MVKRQSLDSQTAEGFKATADAEPKEAAEAADAGATVGASPPSPGKGGKEDTVRINPFDADSDDSSYNLFDGSALGAQSLLPCKFGGGSVLEGEEGGAEKGGESGVGQNEGASGATTDNSKTAITDLPTRAHHPNHGTEVGNRRSEFAARTLLADEAETEARAEAAAGNKGYGFGVARKSGDGAAADGEFGNLATTAALTPDSVGPVPFSSESTATRSRVGSSEPPSSPAPASSLPSTARVERKGSRIAGMLRRFSSRDMDPADAFRIEPLDMDSDDEFGA